MFLDSNESRQAITAPYYSEIDLSAMNENENSSLSRKQDNWGIGNYLIYRNFGVKRWRNYEVSNHDGWKRCWNFWYCES